MANFTELTNCVDRNFYIIFCISEQPALQSYYLVYLAKYSITAVLFFCEKCEIK